MLNLVYRQITPLPGEFWNVIILYHFILFYIILEAHLFFSALKYNAKQKIKSQIQPKIQQTI